MTKPFRQRGGGHLGVFRATWPFASISVEPGRITLAVVTCRISFVPAEVVAIEPIGFIPILWHGVRIHHTKYTIPEFEVFYSPNRSALLDAIKVAGFHVGEPPSPWGNPRKLG